MFLVILAAVAVQSMAPPPPITTIPRPPAPPEKVLPWPPLAPLSGLSPDGHAKVKAMDDKAHWIIRNEPRKGPPKAWPGNGKAVDAWKRALAGFPADTKALIKAGAALDTEFEGRGIYTGWARTFASIGLADQKILAPYLATSQGRVFIDVPVAPSPPRVDSGQPVPLEVRQNKAVYDLQQAIYARGPDGEILAATAEVKRLEDALPGIAHRQPFDAAALRKAYGDLARAIGRANARRSEIVIEELAKMPADQRALAIERIPYLATPLIATPPAVAR